MKSLAFLTDLRDRALPDGQFRADIEGLRGIAVLLVVLYHIRAPWFAGGYIGVDVFFVLSGYLISGLLVREIESTGRVDFTRFYARRARRLLPAAILVLLSTMIVSRFVYTPDEQTSLAAAAFFSGTYASNFWFTYKSLDYLATSPETNPFLHTWSLSVEEQFYFVWPLLVVLASGARRGRVSRVGLVWVMLAVAALSLASSVVLTSWIQPWAFFLSPPRAWEFAVGALAFLLPNLPLERGRAVPGWAGLTAIVCASMALNEATAFPGFAALVPVLGTALVLRAGAVSAESPLRAALCGGPLKWLGRVSYSWYLWHWPVLVLPVVAFGRFSLTGRALLGLVSLTLAAATYTLLEDPVRRSKLLARRPMWSLAMAAALTLLAGVSGVAWRVTSNAEARTPAQQRYTQAARDYDPLIPAGCALPVKTSVPPDCTFGDRRGQRAIFLFGDSHAGHWFPAVEPIAMEQGWRLIAAVKSECPVPSVTFVLPRLRREFTECSLWREAILRKIESERPPLVFASSSYAYAPFGVSLDQWRSGLAYTLRRMVAAGTHVVLIRDTPRPGFNVPRCLGRARWPEFLRRPDTCSFSRDASPYADVFEVEREVAELVSRVTLVDLTNAICETPECQTEVSGLIKYRDAHHLTRTFASTLRGALLERIPAVTDGGWVEDAPVGSGNTKAISGSVLGLPNRPARAHDAIE